MFVCFCDITTFYDAPYYRVTTHFSVCEMFVSFLSACFCECCKIV